MSVFVVHDIRILQVVITRSQSHGTRLMSRWRARREGACSCQVRPTDYTCVMRSKRYRNQNHTDSL